MNIVTILMLGCMFYGISCFQGSIRRPGRGPTSSDVRRGGAALAGAFTCDYCALSFEQENARDQHEVNDHYDEVIADLRTGAPWPSTELTAVLANPSLLAQLEDAAAAFERSTRGGGQ